MDGQGHLVYANLSSEDEDALLIALRRRLLELQPTERVLERLRKRDDIEKLSVAHVARKVCRERSATSARAARRASIALGRLHFLWTIFIVIILLVIIFVVVWGRRRTACAPSASDAAGAQRRALTAQCSGAKPCHRTQRSHAGSFEFVHAFVSGQVSAAEQQRRPGEVGW